jgi:gentisate 1,2-dioxygenase
MALDVLAQIDIAQPPETVAAYQFDFEQVVEHGLRHLAWLVSDDPAVAKAIPFAWRPVLAD